MDGRVHRSGVARRARSRAGAGTGRTGPGDGAPVRARWPAPRSACAAMDGIAIKAVPAAVGVWQLATGSVAWGDTRDLIPAGMGTVGERERGQVDATDGTSVLFASGAGKTGAGPLVGEVQPDARDALTAEIRRAALAADLVLVIAGSSAGRSDHTAAVVARAGGLAVRGVAV